LNNFQKFSTIDYFGDLTLHANLEFNPVKGGVATWSSHVRRLFIADRTATQ